MSDDDKHRDNRDYWAVDALRQIHAAFRQQAKIVERSRLDESILQCLESAEHALHDIKLMRESSINAAREREAPND